MTQCSISGALPPARNGKSPAVTGGALLDLTGMTDETPSSTDHQERVLPARTGVETGKPGEIDLVMTVSSWIGVGKNPEAARYRDSTRTGREPKLPEKPLYEPLICSVRPSK